MDPQSVANPHTSAASPRVDAATTDVLFVDLDGTLIATDLLAEGLLLAARRHPLKTAGLFMRSWGNRAALKRAVAQDVMPDVRNLPFRDEVIEYLQEERAAGRKLVLATASDERWAREVAGQLGLFDDVIASDGHRNLKGRAKLEAIEQYCQQHGHARFSYLGDSSADLPIWEHAAARLVVAPSEQLLTQLQRDPGTLRVFAKRLTPRWALFSALRPHQWVKNLLLLAPLVLAHEFRAVDKLFALLWALIAFCCAASATYVLNDVLDVEADRLHPRKRRRAFASGALPVAWGPPLVAGLMTVAAGISLGMLPWQFSALLALYCLTTILYSWWLKHLVLVDVFVLAGLYTLRILAGGVATAVPVSEWLMALSLFLFVSLAFGKRSTELRISPEHDDLSHRRRGYRRSDLALLETVGPTCGCLAVLVLALYIHGDIAPHLYPQRWALWLICPLFMYWITRFWLLAKRGELSDDPLVFAFRDRGSLMVGFVAALLALVAMYQG
jgi:4-hydroxybenzoate polyprenyltransferase/phosphoserine phosphatase